MKIVLQHAGTALYLQSQGSWTRDVSQAMDFVSSKQAIKYLKQNELPGMQVLVVFIEPACIDTVRLQLPESAALKPAA